MGKLTKIEATTMWRRNNRKQRLPIQFSTFDNCAGITENKPWGHSEWENKKKVNLEWELYIRSITYLKMSHQLKQIQTFSTDWQSLNYFGE